MLRPPRDPNESVIGRSLLTLMIGQGLFIGVVQFIGFALEYFVFTPQDIGMARSVALYLCILAQNLHAFNVRSQRLSIFRLGVFSNPWLIWSFATVTVLTLMTAYVPIFHTILQTKAIGLGEWVMILSLAILPVIGMEIVKAVWARRDARRGQS
jgi:Ca2+-transporting ATPase